MTILRPLSKTDNVVTPPINFALPSQENIPKYLFRYISLQAFINIFFLKQFIFRSAVFYKKDKYECTYPYKDLLPRIGAHQSFRKYYSLMSRERGRFFISCWFGSKDPYPKETMRNYFSKDGVILAFDGKKLVDAFKSNINFLHLKSSSDSRANVFKLHSHGCVEYYTKNEIIEKINSESKIIHPAFAKTKEFELEKEYRFVVDINKKLLEFNFLNQFPSMKEKFKGAFQHMFAKPKNNKSFNDMGLIKVIACSDETKLALIHFENMGEATFYFPEQGKKSTPTIKAYESMKIIDWRSAVDNGIGDI